MTIDPEVLRAVPNMNLVDAKQIGFDYVGTLKSKKVKVDRLRRDIENAPTSDEVCRILYMLELGGEGLTTVGSKWKEHYSKNA
jgi:hypothetical protein